MKNKKNNSKKKETNNNNNTSKDQNKKKTSSASTNNNSTNNSKSGSILAVVVAIIATAVFFIVQQQQQQASKDSKFTVIDQQQNQQTSPQQQQQVKSSRNLITNPSGQLFLLVDNEENEIDLDEDDVSWEYYNVDTNNDNNSTAKILSTTVVTVYPNGGGGKGEEVTLEQLISSGRTHFYNGKGRKVDLTQPIQLITTNVKGDDNVVTHDNDKNSVLLQHYKTKLFESPSRPGLHFYWPLVDVGTKITLDEPASPLAGKQIVLEMLSHSPRIFMVHNFISDEEIEKLQEFSQSDQNPYRMRRSTAGTHKSWAQGGTEDVITTRTSTNAFDISTQTSRNIKERSFQLLRIPKFVMEMSDGIQILKYQTQQAYVAHHDYFPIGQSNDHNWDPSKGGSNRMATVFLYMTDVEEGGHTCFPQADMSRTNPDQNQKNTTKPLEEILSDAGIEPGSWEYKLTQDCYHKFSVQPKKGSALLFYSQLPDGRLDPKSKHGAGPVLGGPDKWGANVWIWNACRYSQCSKDKAQGGLYPTHDIDFEY